PRGARARDHGAANGGGGVAGCAAPGPLQGQGSGVRHGNHALGGDSEGHGAGGLDRDLRGAGPRVRAGPRRDDGVGHADRQLEPDQPVAVLAGEYPGRAARAQLPRSGPARGAGSHVRGAGAARHHARGEPARRGDHGALRAQVRPAMSNGSVSAAPAAAVHARLERAFFERRAMRSLMLTAGVWLAAIIAAVPLVSVLYLLIVRGGSRLSIEALTALPPAGFEMGGGFGNAI